LAKLAIKRLMVKGFKIEGLQTKRLKAKCQNKAEAIYYLSRRNQGLS